jgi:hypothetical protein
MDRSSFFTIYYYVVLLGCRRKKHRIVPKVVMHDFTSTFPCSMELHALPAISCVSVPNVADLNTTFISANEHEGMISEMYYH